MKLQKMRWLRLELQSDASVSSMYLIFHTHYSMYSYLEDQGHTLRIYQPLGADRFTPNGVVYIQTDHNGFFESCLKNYARDFDISGMAPDFEPDRGYEPMFTSEGSFQQAIGIG